MKQLLRNTCVTGTHNRKSPIKSTYTQISFHQNKDDSKIIINKNSSILQFKINPKNSDNNSFINNESSDNMLLKNLDENTNFDTTLSSFNQNNSSLIDIGTSNIKTSTINNDVKNISNNNIINTTPAFPNPYPKNYDNDFNDETSLPRLSINNQLFDENRKVHRLSFHEPINYDNNGKKISDPQLNNDNTFTIITNNNIQNGFANNKNLSINNGYPSPIINFNPFDLNHNSNNSINEKQTNEGHEKSLHKHSNSITKAINFFHKSKGSESPIRKFNRSLKKTIRSLSPIRKDIYGNGKKDKNKHDKKEQRESSTYSNTKLSNDITNDLTGPTYSNRSSTGNNSNSNYRLSNDKMNEIVHYENGDIDYAKSYNNTNKDYIDSNSNTNSATTMNNSINNNSYNNNRNKSNRTSQQQQSEFKIVDIVSVHSNVSNENEIDNNVDYSNSQRNSQSYRNSNKTGSDIYCNRNSYQNKDYSISAHSASNFDAKLHSYSLIRDKSPHTYKKNNHNSYSSRDKRSYHNSYNSCHSNNSSLRYENWNYNKNQEYNNYENKSDYVRNTDNNNNNNNDQFDMNYNNYNQDIIPNTTEEYTKIDNNDYNKTITEKDLYMENKNEFPINNESNTSNNLFIYEKYMNAAINLYLLNIHFYNMYYNNLDIFEKSSKRVSFGSVEQWNDSNYEINELNDEDKYIRHEIIEKNEILDALEQKLEMPNPLEEWEFGDGKCKRIYPNDIEIEESFFPDGTKQKINSNGNKIVEFSDGSKEITTKEYRQRIQQDGVTKQYILMVFKLHNIPMDESELKMKRFLFLFQNLIYY
ncbi:hypothetical protein LY90DRAFT_516202 [Neocallimastix californiae]|uniref:Centromere protein J C-terminal domain-containing protein n=1 Tax=Neocallimastix californiae TaxID=1754190 RepID=A0A1Y2AF95_9FUNG|nr:hypothetical protein LY90DRAFT_516202 [Neocallimastix californiae]|eukprot:ORY21273.1 hypothetical protein LY90DRAFT_516202 [Neocallimastix californiae]